MVEIIIAYISLFQWFQQGLYKEWTPCYIIWWKRCFRFSQYKQLYLTQSSYWRLSLVVSYKVSLNIWSWFFLLSMHKPQFSITVSIRNATNIADNFFCTKLSVGELVTWDFKYFECGSGRSWVGKYFHALRKLH